MAKAAFDAGDFTLCLELAEKEGNSDPSPEIERVIGLSYLRLGRLEEAVSRLNAYLATEAAAASADLEVVKDERNHAAEQLCLLKADAANELFRAGEASAAIAAYSAIVLSDCPPHAAFAIHNNRGALLLQAGRASEALEDFNAALVFTPNSLDALHNAASTLRALGRGGEALAQFQKCLEVEPQFYLALCGVAECYSMLSRFDEAVAAATVAVDSDRGQARAFVNRGFAKLKGGQQLKQQGNAPTTAAEATPPSSSSLSSAEAVADLEMAQSLGDSSAETDRLLALALAVEGDQRLAAGQDAEAVTAYEKALCHGDLNQSPNLNVLFNYALAQLHLNQRAEAYEGFVYVASLATPDHLLFEASWAAGLVALQDENIPDAVEQLTVAVQARPSSVDALYNLGVALLKSEGGSNESEGGSGGDGDGSSTRREKAQECFQKALALNPAHAPSKQAVAVLGGLNNEKSKAMASARQAAAATSSSAATSQEAEKAQEAPSAPSVAPLADVNAPPPPAAPLAAAPAAAPPPAPSAPPAAAAPPSAPSTAGGEGADEGSTTAANYSTSLAPVAADLSTALDASATHESSSSSSRCDAESEVDGVADDLRSKLRLNHEAAPTTAGGGSAAATATAESAQGAGGTGAAPKKVKVSRRASVVVSQTLTFPLEVLTSSYAKANDGYPNAVDPTRREAFLDPATFAATFGMDLAAFHNLPKWKQVSKKKEVDLF